MMRNLFLLSAVLLGQGAYGFLVAPQPVTRVFVPSSSLSLVSLQAKKKKGKKGGKGFGKTPPPTTEPATKSGAPSPFISQDPSATSEASFLQSVESGGSSNIPTMETATIDPDMPAEERAKKLLRDQYGMRTMAEQRMEDSIQENRKKLDDLKAMADKNEDFDIMAMLPAPLLKGIDTFLKLGVGICTVLFVSAGLGITAEAWSKTSGNPLPENIDSFIVNVVEPNFTTGLLVLLGFSVSLGGFAALQLSSASSVYKEE